MAYSWAPSPADVAPLVPQRLTDPSRTFTATSVPSDSAVQALIDGVAEDVYAAVGTVPDTLSAGAKHVTALGTAVAIERGYTSNEAEERSPRLPDMRKEYETALDRLRIAVQAGVGGEGEPSVEFAFPELFQPTTRSIDGTSWATRW